MRALARTPADRWASAGEFARALATAEQTLHTPGSGTLAAAVPVGYAYAHRELAPEPVTIADPCESRALPGTGSVGGLPSSCVTCIRPVRAQ